MKDFFSYGYPGIFLLNCMQEWTICIIELRSNKAGKTNYFITVRTSVLKLVELESLVAKILKYGNYSPAKSVKFCIFLYYA